MYLECYEFLTDRENSIYRFSSSGDFQTIEMMVHFQLIGFNYYNISFGVYNHQTGKIDIYTRTRNNDTTKIFSTLAHIIFDFTNHQHDAIIILIGATKSRNRLFRIIISLYFELIQNEFKIYGAYNDKWEKFSSNRAYDSFYFQRIH
jgi:hypothetical protein